MVERISHFATLYGISVLPLAVGPRAVVQVRLTRGAHPHGPAIIDLATGEDLAPRCRIIYAPALERARRGDLVEVELYLRDFVGQFYVDFADRSKAAIDTVVLEIVEVGP